MRTNEQTLERMRKSAKRLEKKIASHLELIEKDAENNDTVFQYQSMLYTFAKKLRDVIS